LYVTLYIETIDQVLDNVRKEATDEDSLILSMGTLRILMGLISL